MEKVWLSATYYLDPAVLGLSDGAEVLFTRMIAYCGAAETFGIVTETALKTLGVRALFRKKSELLTAGLVIEIEPGKYKLKGWDRWQQSGDDMLKRRKSDAERKRRQREKEAEQSRDMSRDVTPENRGEKKRDRSTYVDPSSHLSNTRAADEPRGPAVNVEAWKLVRTAIPDAHPQAVRTDLAMRVNQLLTAGTPPDTITAALHLWLTKPDAGTGLLPWLVSEATRTANPATPTTRSMSTADKRVADAQALRARFGATPLKEIQ